MGSGVPGSTVINPVFSVQDGASGEQLLTDVGEAERTRALERFQILRPCLEHGVPLAQLSRERKLQLRTLQRWVRDRKSTRLNSSHLGISYAVFCLKKKKAQ